MLCPDQAHTLSYLGGSVWKFGKDLPNYSTVLDLVLGGNHRHCLTELLNSSGFVQPCVEMNAPLAILEIFRVEFCDVCGLFL